MKEQLENIQHEAEGWDPEALLRWAAEFFGDEVAMASGFGPEGVALIDMATRVQPRIRIFTLDTDFLFPETYQLIEKIEQRYGIAVERVKSSLTPAEQERRHGAALWAADPDACCDLRKVEPLRRKLAGLRAWITSIRREQTAARATAQKLGWDAKFHLVKINPLADWTSKQVWSYIHERRLDYNPLHDRGYPSIGCTHCTRAVLPGEDARAGRWSGFSKTECGLHLPASQVVAIDILTSE